jgi:uncharacterized protein YbcV (DUF1398 family)
MSPESRGGRLHAPLSAPIAAIQSGIRPRPRPGSSTLVVVFTMAEIDDLHARLGRADSLADYLRSLAALGVVRFDSFVTDGHSEFFGSDGQSVVSPAHHQVLAVAEVSDRDSFLRHLRRHSDGETSYVEMSRGLADSGIEKWVADTGLLTMTYHDAAGVPLLLEQVE